MVKVLCVEMNPFQALALLINIHHGINLARDAIQFVNKSEKGCGLLDLDFMAGFDWLDLAWTYCKVLKSIQMLSPVYLEYTPKVLTRSLAAHWETSEVLYVKEIFWACCVVVRSWNWPSSILSWHKTIASLPFSGFCPPYSRCTRLCQNFNWWNMPAR